MKSHVRDLMAVAEVIYYDVSAKCAAEPQTRDLETMRLRAEHEGMSFFTITLPTLGKDLEQVLATGRIAPNHFRCFKKWRRIPAFLRGIFELVLDSTTGGLLDDPRTEAIEGLRQIAYTFKKLGIACTPKRVKKALTEYTLCERVFEDALDPGDVDYFNNVSAALWYSAFAGSDSFPNICSLLPKHGPGSTAERILGNEKYVHAKWHERLEPYFPMLDFAFANCNARDSIEFEQIRLVIEEEEQPVRVVTVPKTLKTPRIIAIEPVCMQYTQQAVSAALIRRLESYWLTKGRVNFTDQKINQRLAMRSSASGKLATLDMSEASDRVPYSLAISMFNSNPDLQGAISACRSKRAQIGDLVIDLRKFASMGSALCFPVEAMYFYTICVVALLRFNKLPVTPRNIYKVTRRVFVYGDDIIVPADAAATVMEHLQKYYCKVNTSKSFWTGKFRESCGVDAYDGEAVTATYVRTVRPHERRQASELISWVKTGNQFYQKGYWKTAHYFRKQVERVLGALPLVGPNDAGLGWLSFQQPVKPECPLTNTIQKWMKRPKGVRWNWWSHAVEIKAWVPAPVHRDDALTGQSALTKCLLNLERSEETLTEREHLVKTARFGAVALKRRWIQPVYERLARA